MSKLTTWLKMIGAAAAGGAVERLGVIAATGKIGDIKDVGVSTATGAVIGVLLLLAKSPTQPPAPDQKK